MRREQRSRFFRQCNNNNNELVYAEQELQLSNIGNDMKIRASPLVL